jgi:hypothetical protein
MKLVKSLLLGSAAGLAAVAGAQAADLPSKKAAPVEYVRVCSAFGAGFFFIPGTDSCLRISGRVRAEYRYAETLWSVPGNGRAADAIGFRARGRLNVDVRTPTPYGTLRTFFRYELTGNRGNYGPSETSALDKAFVQWNLPGFVLTAGRAASFFDFYANDLNWGTIRGSDLGTQNLLAFTVPFGGGFSATLSLEDSSQRNTTYALDRVNGVNLPGTSPVVYGGQRMPDIVGNLRIDQGWGSAQLSGALHQLYLNNRSGINAAGVQTGLQNNNGVGPFVENEFGWAIQGGLKFNLPMIAAGDVLWLQAAYAEGALSYLGYGGVGIGPVSLRNADAIIDQFGNVQKTKGFAIAAGFLHYWTPSIRQGIFGSYAELDYSNSVQTALLANGAFPGAAMVDGHEWRIGTNLIWSPVKDFDIGVEVLYTNLDPKGRLQFTNAAGAFLGTSGNQDTIEARLRIQRDF